ncbi:MAG TPA: M1 family peptidase, partial [Chitinophagaceae bacterium]|nr:M1 family peptidase [Chitinophagaceae bacterium]
AVPMEEAIETPSADFSNKDTYGYVVYLKTAIWMYILELSVGKDKLEKTIKAYYNDWKFKHPYPEDFKAEFEKNLGIKVDKLFELLKKTGKFE